MSARHKGAVLVALGVLAVGCTTGSPALLSRAIPRCEPGVHPSVRLAGQPAMIPGWSVTATGAVSYASSEAVAPETGIDVDGALASVDVAASSFSVSTATGDVDVHVTPVRSGWLDALPIGTAVHAHFENGVELTRSEDGALLLAIVGRPGSIRSASFDVGPLHVDGGAAECISPFFDGSFCTYGGVVTGAALTMGVASALAAGDGTTVSITDGTGRAYEVSVVGAVRQASADELAPYVMEGVACAAGLATATVVAVGIDPDALLWCAPSAGRVAPTPGYPPMFSWSVTATGAVAYSVVGGTPTSVDATLAAVGDGTIELASAGGAIHVALSPVDPDWLTRMPIGRAVHARFENGLVLRDAADDALLLALVGQNATIHAPAFDVAPVHVAEGTPRCIEISNGGFSCSVGGTGIDAAFTLGATTVSQRAGAPASRLAESGIAFDVATVGSMRQATGEELAAVGIDSVCAPALGTTTVVAIAAAP